jgi:hypothetical protein
MRAVFAGLTGTIAQSRDLEPVFPGSWLWRSPRPGRAPLRGGVVNTPAQASFHTVCKIFATVRNEGGRFRVPDLIPDPDLVAGRAVESAMNLPVIITTVPA